MFFPAFLFSLDLTIRDRIDCVSTPKPLMAYSPSFQQSIITVKTPVYVQNPTAKPASTDFAVFQDQWKKKKQTKEQAAAARRAKLDPDSAKSAKDVMDERARKRKLEELEDVEESDIGGVEKEQPKQGLRIPQERKTKKQKVEDNAKGAQSAEKQVSAAKTSKSYGADERRLKQEQKKEKKKKKAEEKIKAQEAAAQKAELPSHERVDPKRDSKADAEDSAEGDDEELPVDEIGYFEAEGLEENQDEQDSNDSSPPSPTFDNPTEPSANTSTSSVIPPATAPKHIKLPTDPELLRARLAARIEALRAARKADGPDGAPARNRQELMEARRKKEEQRRAHKKELEEKQL